MSDNQLVPAPEQNSALQRDWYVDVPRSGRWPSVAGYAVLLFGVAGFGAWASTAPIDGAVVTSGVFVATSQNKIVQHLEGGIIKNILAKEGELVRKGDTLVRLENTNAIADLRRLELRQAQRRATDKRLAAESAGKSAISFPQDLLAKSHSADVAAILKSQQDIFDARRQKLKNEIDILKKSIASFQQRIKGDEARLESATKQRSLIEEELKDKTKLFKAGLVRKPEYFTLKRVLANIIGEIGHRSSEISEAKERIFGTRAQIERVKNVAIQAAVEERHQIEGELKDIRERITTAKSVLSRIDINAPVQGIVVKLHYHTPGGVIRPGNNIVEIVPVGDELIIEARIRPQDIDNLTNGQEALVRLTALSQRVTPMLPGKVVYVSADALPNEEDRNGDNVYIAKVELDTEEAAKLPNFLPTPGMPAEVYIKTGQRTFFQYLMQPVLDTVARAFRES